MYTPETEKSRESQFFFVKKLKLPLKNIFLKIFLLVKPKYWGKFISATGVSPKWVKSRRRRRGKKKEEKKEKSC